MTTVTIDQQTVVITTGSVIELDIEDQAITALVLLATPEAIILDACDGSMPLVFRAEELPAFRVFDDVA
jgi:hypothetical protein